ncbi:MAG: AI-2E family transporter [Desulfobacterales bacterium]|jgi:predicted PurR-regulated permease PerM
MKNGMVNKSVVLLLIFFISALFLSMIRHFLMAILLAGIFSALAHPLYLWFERHFRGRRNLASLVTLILILLLVLLPLGVLLGIVVAQAIKVGQSVTPWVQKQLAEPAAFSDLLKLIPFYDQIMPYQELILRKAGETVGLLSSFLINHLESLTKMTVNFLLMLFILLYSMFFFLMDGHKLLHKILYYLPLEDRQEQKMLDKFTSVTRATLKGTAVIGLLQGGLAGIAFAAVGIPSAVFWSAVMTVLSIIPGIGTMLVWGPAAIILAAAGNYFKAAALAIFCGLVVGSIDNLLRPRLVGKDTQMHELLIFFGTLGGIAFFGVIGFIIGPIIAALFVTIWDIYGLVFCDILPEVGSLDGNPATDDAQSNAAGDNNGKDD